MGGDIHGVELNESSINSMLIDDLSSHPIQIKRRPHWGILKINRVLGLFALWFAPCIVICVVPRELKHLRQEAFAAIPGFDMSAACMPFSAFGYGQITCAFLIKPKVDVFYKLESARPTRQDQI